MGLVPHPAVDRPARPVVSVCIANYNGEALLDDCIASVMEQDADESIEIIVHDDASTDGSVELLRSRYPGVELLASTENVGFCVANNRMVLHARGEYVLLLNNDAALLPDAVRSLRAAALAGDTGILTLPQYDWETGALVDRGCLLDPFFNPVPNLDPDRREVAYVIGACLWIPRMLWHNLGGFPEWMESVGEDLYLACVARLYGWPVRALFNSGYLHRQGISFGGNRIGSLGLRTSYRRRALSERNKTLAMAICVPSALAWPWTGLHLALLLVEGIILSLYRSDRHILSRIYLPALAAPFRLWQQLSVTRRQVQQARKCSVREFFRNFVVLPRKLEILSRHGLPRIS